MFERSRLVAVLGIAALLLVLPVSAMANVGGAGPRVDRHDPTVSNVGGAGPRSPADRPAQEFANVGGAGPRSMVVEEPTQEFTNVGGAGPTMNVGGASPRSWTEWLVDLLAVD